MNECGRGLKEYLGVPAFYVKSESETVAILQIHIYASEMNERSVISISTNVSFAH